MQSSKKLTFEIQMQEKGCHLLAAESEVELDEWVTALKRALESEERQSIGDRGKEKGSIEFSVILLLCRVIYATCVFIAVTFNGYLEGRVVSCSGRVVSLCYFVAT